MCLSSYLWQQYSELDDSNVASAKLYQMSGIVLKQTIHALKSCEEIPRVLQNRHNFYKKKNFSSKFPGSLCFGKLIAKLLFIVIIIITIAVPPL